MCTVTFAFYNFSYIRYMLWQSRRFGETCNTQITWREKSLECYFCADNKEKFAFVFASKQNKKKYLKIIIIIIIKEYAAN